MRANERREGRDRSRRRGGGVRTVRVRFGHRLGARCSRVRSRWGTPRSTSGAGRATWRRFTGPGIGTALLGWIEERARASGQREVGQTTTDGDTRAASCSSRAGTSRRGSLDHPDGVVRVARASGGPRRHLDRAYEPSDAHDGAQMIDAAFSEWEGRDPSPFEEWASHVLKHAAFAPELSPLAFDGDELVGAVTSSTSLRKAGSNRSRRERTHRGRGIDPGVAADRVRRLRRARIPGRGRLHGLADRARSGSTRRWACAWSGSTRGIGRSSRGPAEPALPDGYTLSAHPPGGVRAMPNAQNCYDRRSGERGAATLRAWSARRLAPLGRYHPGSGGPGPLAFVDISGFTKMTERLARKGKVGAEEMGDPLDHVFTRVARDRLPATVPG